MGCQCLSELLTQCECSCIIHSPVQKYSCCYIMSELHRTHTQTHRHNVEGIGAEISTRLSDIVVQERVVTRSTSHVQRAQPTTRNERNKQIHMKLNNIKQGN